MEPRINYAKLAPDARAAMMGLEQYVHQAGLDRGLLELVKLRASLINGCAYCADMHTKVARSHGETEQRLYAMSVWRETPFYTDGARRAGLDRGGHARQCRSRAGRRLRPGAAAVHGKRASRLTLAIVAINGWNRLAIALRPCLGRSARCSAVVGARDRRRGRQG